MGTLAVSHPELVPKGSWTISISILGNQSSSFSVVFNDGDIALYTLTSLWTNTGVRMPSHTQLNHHTKIPQIRSLDHAVELLYHPLASEISTKRLAFSNSRLVHLPPSLQVITYRRRYPTKSFS
jgi:3-oxoacid CoA-transferase